MFSETAWSLGKLFHGNGGPINGRLGKTTSPKFCDNLDGQYKYGEESKSHEDEALH
jgi:hypothetical protein